MCDLVFIRGTKVFELCALQFESNRELARIAKVSPTTISNWGAWECYRAKLSVVQRVAQALNVRTESLIYEDLDGDEPISKWSVNATPWPMFEQNNSQVTTGQLFVYFKTLRIVLPGSTWDTNVIQRSGNDYVVTGKTCANDRVVGSIYLSNSQLRGALTVTRRSETASLQLTGTSILSNGPVE